MERSRLRALAVIGAVASGCAHGDVAGRTWNEVRTGRITLVTDLDRDDARDRAAELDRLGATLGDLDEIVRPDKPAPVRLTSWPAWARPHLVMPPRGMGISRLLGLAS
jgi:hypothetical protein